MPRLFEDRHVFPQVYISAYKNLQAL